MKMYAPAKPPMGAVQFCEVFPRECSAGPLEDTRLAMTADRWSELDTLNRTINREIRPATDQDLYGQEEWWTLPLHGKGDCEDYALLKRHLLMRRGWPASALLMTVVRDEKGEGHAVLTARTAQGDFILDNKNDEIKPWHKTGYDFVMRQSYINPRAWISLDVRDAQPNLPLAGNRNPR